ncbi:D-2-hydroxyacid dehydrogenase [Marinovum sp.]|uniref:D-2-hydroxyacid dehydrogenase n=1 Tax=Marinovum sp. TaxID=2024839 RepID=UPI002B26B215|nr:D-2-hydroxyacid dehydrogenase [Marinovum sp.]
MKVLIVDPDFADLIAGNLRRDFPGLEVLTAGDAAAGAEAAAGCEVAMLLAMHADDDLFRHAGDLEWVQAFSAGVDKFLSLPSLAGLPHLTNMRGIHGPQIGELTMLFMISLLRDFPGLIRQQDRRDWHRRPGRKLQGRTVTVWGMGAIGLEIARLAAAFGMTVNAVSRTPRDHPFIDRWFAPVALEEAVAATDFLVASAPATPGNIGRLDAGVFATMPREAYLINVGRGSLVVEPDLIAALQAGALAGAALDVASREPLPPDNPLWAMPNVTLTPHIAGMIEEYPEQIYPIVKTNMARYLAGETDRMINRIDPAQM